MFFKMNSEKEQTKEKLQHLNYVINVLKFDVSGFLKEAQGALNLFQQNTTNGTTGKAHLEKVMQNTAKSSIGIRDSLALLTLISEDQKTKDISLNKIIDNSVKNLFFDIQSEKKDVNVSFHPSAKDIMVQGDELILQTLIYKIFDLAWEQIFESKVVFTTSYDSGFATISMKYQGKKHKMMNPSVDFNEEPESPGGLPEFNNPFSLLKIFEKSGLGVLSFSRKDNFHIINFTLHLPTKQVDTQKSAKLKSVENHKWENKTVLIVDDIEVNFIFLETILADTHIKTLYATNGQIAVDMCKKNNDIDVVLMDIKMPVMDGYEATRLIKKDNPDLPVIIQTAYSFNEEYERCRELGCNDYITKPLKSENVISVLAKYLAG
jgi:two-component system, cell cycle response regulator DivK